MKSLIFVVHNHPARFGVDCYWQGEQPGDSADERCCDAEESVIAYLENMRDKAGWPDNFVVPEDKILDLENKMRTVAYNLFPEIDLENLCQNTVAVYNSQP